MKIAILTLRLHTNYGGILQAYALQKTLRDMGHDAVTLQCNAKTGHNALLMPLVYLKRIIKKCLGKYDRPIFAERTIRRNDEIVSVETRRFINEHIHTKELRSLNDITKTDYNAVVVGSDQVWRKQYFTWDWNTCIANAFLKFANGWVIKRIAYAASFGVDKIGKEYSPTEIRDCAGYLKMFDAVSIREDAGVDICRDEMDVAAQHVLDPTMLLTKDDYIKIVESANTPASNGNMLSYFIDKNEFKSRLATQISVQEKLSPILFGVMYDETDSKNLKVQPSVETWLRGFMDAELVVTDSFHACVFSIIFNKPFIVVGNEKRGVSRISSLLKQFNIETNLVLETDDISSGSIMRLVAGARVACSRNIEPLRTKSKDFLKQSLK